MPRLSDLLSGDELSKLKHEATPRKQSAANDAAADDAPAAPAEPLMSMRKGDTFEGALLVKLAEVRTSSNGSRFLDITLGDRSGDMGGKSWDWGDVPAPKVGSVVHVRAMITEFNNRLQLRVDRLRDVSADAVEWNQLVPSAPDTPQAMLSAVDAAIAGFSHEGLRVLVAHIVGEHRADLTLFPAAVSFHHAERSGLLHHITSMLKGAHALCDIYPGLNADLLKAGVILHDIGKLKELTMGGFGLAEEYTAYGLLLGHITIGVGIVAEAGQRLGTDPELIMLLSHMLLAHHGTSDFGSPKPPMTPEAEALHHLDVLDARMYDMLTALENTEPGAMSERVRSLENRRLYKAKGMTEPSDAAITSD